MPYERKTIDILVSDKLKDILKEIEHDSEVARLLLKRRHDKEDLVENPVNYVSISTDDKSKISYLTEDRKKDISEVDYWTSSRRFQTKPGSFIGKVFKNISGKEVEKFSNLFRSQSVKQTFDFKVVKGEKIRMYYDYQSYADDSGSLGASCMKHEHCMEYLNMYVDNVNHISMLVMLNDDGGLMGRALLWNFESYKIMDRIYTINDEYFSYYFKQWATTNGYLYKSEQNWCNTLNFEQIGSKKQELKLSVKLEFSTYKYYPYLDTFKFIDIKNEVLYNYQPEDVNFKTLCASDGTKFSKDYLKFDDIDKVFMYEGDSVKVDYLKIVTHRKNVEWSQLNDCVILRKDCVYNEELSDFVFSGDYSHLNKEFPKNKKISLEEIRKILNLSSSEISEIISSYDGLFDSNNISNILEHIQNRRGGL